jgi:predicted secreted protein
MKSPANMRAKLKIVLHIFLVVAGWSTLAACDGVVYTDDPGLTRFLMVIGIPVSPTEPDSQRVHPHAATHFRPFGTFSTLKNPEIAPFFGNLSAVTLAPTAAANDAFVLARQDDCSLTFLEFGIALNGSQTSLVVTPDAQIPHYEKTMQSNAFLTTTPDVFPKGCVDSPVGNTSRLLAAFGEAKNESEIIATVGNMGIITSAVQANGSFTGPTTLATNIQPITVIGADLNKDGNPDGVSVNTNGLQSSITVFIGKDDGTFQPGVNLALPGSAANYAVIDDLDGDGNLDILVSSGGATFQFSLFFGNGDGTFKPVQNFSPAGNTFDFSHPFITADVNGDHIKDIICGNGQIFLGTGDGVTFTLVPQLPFSEISSGSSGYSTQIIAADFNNDGKLDLATDDGATIRTFKGNGDGTFVAGPAYATISDFGFMIATDLDGDGNIDIWSGYGGNYGYSGTGAGLGFALMGNGDGTFQGAPSLPASYIGTNLGDLNGDHRSDVLLLTPGATQTTFTSFMSNSNGIPVAGPQLTVPAGVFVDSYAVGDLTGDKVPDLVFVSSAPQTQSFYVAIGNGDGSFQAPTATPTPSLVPSGLDVNEDITGLRLADINHDGKLDLVYSFADEDAHTAIFTQGFVVQLGNGDGTFGAPQITTTYSSTTAPLFAFSNMLSAIADVNADNFPDVFMVLPTVITNGTAQHESQLFVGNGDGTFKAPSTLALTGNVRAADPSSGSGSPFAFADLNGDGKVDLIAGGSSADGTTLQVAIALGNGDGTFKPATIMLIEGFGFVNSIGVADFDGDGKVDLFVGGVIEGIPGIFPGNGDGTFQSFANPDGALSGTQSVVLNAGGGVGIADFNGDGKPDMIVGNVVLINKNGSVAPPLASTSTAVTSSLNPSTTGASVTFTATVTSATAGTITGNVTFLVGANTLGTSPVGAAGVATFTTSTLTAGSNFITAQYVGDTNFAGSTSPVLTQTVNGAAKAATTTTLASSLNPSTTGTSVTFTATVTSGTAGTITGSVTFLDGANTLGTGTVGAGGVATFATTSLTSGSHSVTAQYVGDSNFSTSTSTALSQQVNAGALTSTTTALTGPATSAAGASVTFTATVTPASGTKVPTGTVTFLDGQMTLGTGPLNGSGVATFSTTALSTGTQSITAMYGGDANFATSTSTALSINITGTPSFTLSVAPSSVTVTPTQAGMAVLTVTPANGFNQAVQFSCSNVPEGVDCEFQPNSVTPNGGPITTMLSVTEETENNMRGRKLRAAIAPSIDPSNGPSFGPTGSRGLTLPLKSPFVPVLGGELLLLAGLWRRKKSANVRGGFQIAYALLLLVTIGTFVGGCANNPPSNTTGTTITITAVGPNNQMAMAPLVVNVKK